MALSDFYNDRQAFNDLVSGQQRNMLAKQAGSMLAGGDTAGAANALFKGGQIDAGYKVRGQADAQAAEQHKKEVEFAGNFATGIAKRLQARIDPEQAWKEGEQYAAAQGVNPQELAALRQRWDAMGPEAFTQWLGSAAEKEAEQFTLGPGAARYDANGKLVASQPFAPQYRSVGAGDTLVEVGGNVPAAPAQAAPSGNPEEVIAPLIGLGARMTSGTRSPTHNAEVGGVPNSRHLSGQAADLVPPPSMTLAQLAAEAKRLIPGARVLKEGDHVHVQWGQAQPQGQGARVVAQGAQKPTARPATAAEKAQYGISPDVPAEMGPNGLRVITGTGAGQRRVPAAIQKGFAENNAAITQIDQAIAALEANPGAMGLKNILGDEINQRLDPNGIDARAAVANIGSLIIHDRSGAAVTAAETPRLKPFIPMPTDGADAAIKKLKLLRQQYGNTNTQIEIQYGPDSGYTSMGGSGASDQPAPKAPPSAQAKAPAKSGGGSQLPSQARAQLKAGQITTFSNGQRWTLRNGAPVRIN